MKQFIDNAALFGALAGSATTLFLHLPVMLILSLIWISWVGVYFIAALLAQVTFYGAKRLYARFAGKVV